MPQQLSSFPCHLSNPRAINFMDDVLIALELISVFLSPLPVHSLHTARLISLMHCFLQATPLLKRSHNILLVLKMSNEQTQPSNLRSSSPIFVIWIYLCLLFIKKHTDHPGSLSHCTPTTLQTFLLCSFVFKPHPAHHSEITSALRI